MHNVSILITSAVNVQARRTKLLDSETRKTLTLHAVREWIERYPRVRVVVCDGTGHDFTNDLRRASITPFGSVEALNFHNDESIVKEKGKGFGEGQIVSYALKHSRLLKESDFFAKCTARLWTDNFDSCIRSLRSDAGFDYQGRSTSRFIDTRFYIVRPSFYMANLEDAHLTVDEDNGLCLEHAFRNRLDSLHPSKYLLRTVPNIYGVSGSMAIKYEPNVIKNRTKSFRNRIVRLMGIFP